MLQYTTNQCLYLFFSFSKKLKKRNKYEGITIKKEKKMVPSPIWTFPILFDDSQNEVLFSSFEPFMCSNERKQQVMDKEEVVKNEVVENEVVVVETTNKEKEETSIDRLYKQTFYAKGCQDSLFWSIYIAKHGYNEFLHVGANNGKVELKEKQAAVDCIHALGAVKLSEQFQHKLTKVYVNELISELLTKPKMSYSGVYAICAYYQCQVCIVDLEKNTYLHFANCASNVDLYILYKNPKKKHSYFVDVGHQLFSMEKIQQSMYCLVHYDKPLKSISNYTLSQLEELAEIVGVPVLPKMKKQGLFDAIALRCVF
jgi:hypothetical protein